MSNIHKVNSMLIIQLLCVFALTTASLVNGDLQLLTKPIPGGVMIGNLAPVGGRPPSAAPITLRSPQAGGSIKSQPISLSSQKFSSFSFNPIEGEKALMDSLRKQNSFIVNPFEDDCVSEYNVKYVVLVLSWQPGICATGKIDCKRQQNDFSVHGLWPQLDDRSSPKCCTRQVYNERILDKVRQKLKAIWPTLNSGKDEEFWSYEWDKHGRCADQIKGINTVEKYFEFVIKEYGNLNLSKRLIKEGIEPSRHSTYYGEEIQSDLKRVLGTDVELFCQPKASDPSQMLLTEIGICYDIDNMRRVDCRQWKRSCRGELIFNKV